MELDPFVLQNFKIRHKTYLHVYNSIYIHKNMCVKHA